MKKLNVHWTLRLDHNMTKPLQKFEGKSVICCILQNIFYRGFDLNLDRGMDELMGLWAEERLN